MREKFDSELQRIKKISAYDTERACRMLDDMATAYISVSEYGHLDTALTAVKVAKKAMRAQGLTQDLIDDYFLQRSYLSKTQLRDFKNQSIYTDTGDIAKTITSKIALFTDRTTTDLIIDRLQSQPELLSALKRGVSAQYITQKLDVPNSTLLINFYKKHKSIIDN
jgi:hypothetical protein